MKKLILSLFMITMLTGCVSVHVKQEEITTVSVSETSDINENTEQLEYKSNGNGTCIVTGMGTYTDSRLVIPSRNPDGEIVVSVGEKAFGWNSDITSVEIPSSVKTIGFQAFDGCENLVDVYLPEGIEFIGDASFAECPIAEIDIPESVKSIGDGAFMYCENLAGISIPETAEEIGNLAFFETSFWREYPEDFVVVGNGVLINYKGSSKEVTIPDNVKYISQSFGYMEYRNSVVEKIIVPETVEGYGEYAFAGCNNLKEIILPDNMKYLPDNAFYSCCSLEEIIIPDEVESIGESAFDGCELLESIVIPKGVTEMGATVFNHTDNITVYCEAESKPQGWDDEWDTIYSEDGNKKVDVIWGYKGD